MDYSCSNPPQSTPWKSFLQTNEPQFLHSLMIYNFFDAVCIDIVAMHRFKNHLSSVGIKKSDKLKGILAWNLEQQRSFFFNSFFHLDWTGSYSTDNPDRLGQREVGSTSQTQANAPQAPRVNSCCAYLFGGPERNTGRAASPEERRRQSSFPPCCSRCSHRGRLHHDRKKAPLRLHRNTCRAMNAARNPSFIPHSILHHSVARNKREREKKK